MGAWGFVGMSGDIISNACPACEQARENPLTGAYRAACFECSARSIASSPAFFEERIRAGHKLPMSDEYKALLIRAFDGAWRAGHESAKSWHKRLNGGCK